MPPPPPGIGGIAFCFFGSSATIASVLMSKPATEEAPCSGPSAPAMMEPSSSALAAIYRFSGAAGG
jgi:hypothetical protein